MKAIYRFIKFVQGKWVDTSESYNDIALEMVA